MALIGLMGILLYGACGSEKKEIPKQIYIGVACYDQRDTFLGNFWKILKGNAGALEKRGYDISLTLWMLQIPKGTRRTYHSFGST